MKLKALFITTQFPYPAHGGGKLVTLKHISLLLRDFSVDVVCKAAQLPDQSLQEAFKKKYPINQLTIFPHWIKTRQNKLKATKAFVRAFIQKLPYKILKHHNVQLEESVHQQIQSRTYDLIVFDQLPSFQPGSLNILSSNFLLFAHNAEFETVATHSKQQSNGVKKWFLNLEARRMERYERKVYRQVKNVVFISAVDAAQFPEIEHPIVLPSFATIFTSRWQLHLPQKMKQTPILFMVASWSWALNREGLLWFTKYVVPHLRFQVEICIAGDGIERSLKVQLEKNSSIKVVGKVEEVQSYYNRSSVVVVPLFGGSGIKIKVVDAMSQGLPIVTTTFGVQGLEDFSEGICVANTSVDFARYIDTLVENETYYMEMQHKVKKDFLQLSNLPVSEILSTYLKNLIA